MFSVRAYKARLRGQLSSNVRHHVNERSLFGGFAQALQLRQLPAAPVLRRTGWLTSSAPPPWPRVVAGVAPSVCGYRGGAARRSGQRNLLACLHSQRSRARDA